MIRRTVLSLALVLGLAGASQAAVIATYDFEGDTASATGITDKTGPVNSNSVAVGTGASLTTVNGSTALTLSQGTGAAGYVSMGTASEIETFSNGSYGLKITLEFTPTSLAGVQYLFTKNGGSGTNPRSFDLRLVTSGTAARVEAKAYANNATFGTMGVNTSYSVTNGNTYRAIYTFNPANPSFLNTNGVAVPSVNVVLQQRQADGSFLAISTPSSMYGFTGSAGDADFPAGMLLGSSPTVPFVLGGSYAFVGGLVGSMDNVVVETLLPIPEPASLGLAGLGLLLIGSRRFSRKNA